MHVAIISNPEEDTKSKNTGLNAFTSALSSILCKCLCLPGLNTLMPASSLVILSVYEYSSENNNDSLTDPGIDIAPQGIYGNGSNDPSTRKILPAPTFCIVKILPVKLILEDFGSMISTFLAFIPVWFLLFFFMYSFADGRFTNFSIREKQYFSIFLIVESSCICGQFTAMISFRLKDRFY